jgi:uncharacterized protein (TIGR00369 family)
MSEKTSQFNSAARQSYGPGKPLRDGKQVSGLEFLQGIVRDKAMSSNFNAGLGIRLIEVEQGRAVFHCEPGMQHMNALGIVHGGLAATLIDSATGSAVLSMQPAGGRSTTLELKVNFVRPITTKTGPVTCEAKVIHMGRRVATSDARVVDAQGKLIAHGSATLMVFQPEDGG